MTDINPERAHTLICKIGADSKKDLINTLHRMANLLERDMLTEGCSGGYSSGYLYRYKVSPEVTHDSYFTALDKILSERKHEI